MSARRWRVAYVAVAAAFLATVATYYHPGTGFTAFIEFPAAGHDGEFPLTRATPHFDHEGSGGYDGQFYAQLALEPLVRDPAIDRAMDNAPYRARRILFAWTAYALGLGQPAWVLQAYALQNVVAWLVGAWLLCRWMPPSTSRYFALWSGCLLSHGFLSSVRYALPDAPSAMLLTAGLAIEAPVLAALCIGLAALGRETSILGAARFLPLLISRQWRLLLVCALVCVLPLALWLDYLRSVFLGMAFAGGDHITAFGAGIGWKIGRLDAQVAMRGWDYPAVASILALAAFVAQSGIIVAGLVRSRGRDPWALVGFPFVALALVTHQDVYAGTPGAFTRVFLPVAIAANVLLATWPRVSWALIAAANLGVIPGVLLFGTGWG